jgi:hypothetical protein
MTPDTTHRHPAAPASTGAGRSLDIRFRGIPRGVLVPDRPDLRQGLEDVLAGWPTDIRPLARPADARGEVVSALHPSPDGATFALASRYTDTALYGLGLAGALCGLLADVLTAHAEANPGTFTLHCGAVRFGDGLAVLCGPRRAGKSTLVARLAAEPDLAVFCDDVLPVDAEGHGLALGLAPRLRLPLPPVASARFRDHVAAHLGPADDRYGYLCTPTVARHGTRAPIAALIVLDRRESGAARLHRLDPGEGVQHLLSRNFGDLQTPAHAFALAEATARAARCLTLVYADLEDAVALLRRALLGDGVEIAPPLPPAPAGDLPNRPADPDTVWSRADDAVIRRVGASAFLWRPADTTLWQMNPVAEMAWTALEIPGSARDVADTLADVFPDEPPDRILADTAALLARLADHDLARPLSPAT